MAPFTFVLLSPMASLTHESFGQTEDGHAVTRYTLRNSNNVVVRILNYGGVITDILVPDRHGVMDDISLGFDNMEGYNTNTPYLGALIGRFTNRIAGAKFSLDGKTYTIATNDGANFIHGGLKGFDKMVWDASVVSDRKLQLHYISRDGEEGFPGELTTTVTYELTDDNQLIIQYKATTTKATPINLTNHAYFNLGGHSAGDIDDHVVTINSETYAVLDKQYLPSGEMKSVDGSLYDLRKPVRLGDRMASVQGGEGYIVSYNVDQSGKLSCVARVDHPPSGRFLECFTTEPSVMFYTSYNLDNVKGKGGVIYRRYGALCLEAQHHPDSINQPSFPNAVLRPGETYTQTTIYKFGLKK